MCNKCFQKSGRRLGESPFPKEDMFGGQVFEFYPDKEKASVRQNYLNTLPEFQELNRIRKTNFTLVLKLLLIIFITIPISVAVILSVVSVSFKTPALGLSLAMFSFIIIFALAGILIYTMMKNNKPNMIREKELRLHENKLRYYANQFVIGFSVLDHTTHDDNGTDYYYAFYEIDKNNIRGISYDPKFGEYIFILYKPVYYHYDFPPTIQFRLPDIFEDSILSTVLNCDLPPKHIPY